MKNTPKKTSDLTVYLPRCGELPAEPAPYVMTQTDVGRFLRLPENTNWDDTLYRYRKLGMLKGTQVGRDVRYLLPDVLDALKAIQKANPR